MKNAFFAFHKNHIKQLFCRSVCVQIKILRCWTIERPTTLVFSVFIHIFFRFTFFFPRFSLLQFFAFYQVFFGYNNFRESVKEARTSYHGQAKGGKGNSALSFALEILTVFQAPSI